MKVLRKSEGSVKEVLRKFLENIEKVSKSVKEVSGQCYRHSN